MVRSGSGRSQPPRARWEWRAFWSTPAPGLSMHEVLVKPARCRRKRLIDRYLVINSRQDNIKVRNCRLEVKQLVEQYDRFEAYRRKQRYPFPLAAREVMDLFPRLSEPDRVFAGVTELEAALDDHGYRLRCYEVRKERYKRRVGRVTIEWAALAVARRRFWSVAATGPKLAKVAARAAKLPNNFTLLGGYSRLLAELDRAT
jgi:hypothetical protein